MLQGQVVEIGAFKDGKEVKATWNCSTDRCDLLNGDVLAIIKDPDNTKSIITSKFNGETATTEISITENTIQNGTRFKALVMTTTKAIEGYILEFLVNGAVVANNTLTFSSSNPEIATVDSAGKVKAVSLGKSLIITTKDGKKYGHMVTVVETHADGGETLSEDDNPKRRKRG